MGAGNESKTFLTFSKQLGWSGTRTHHPSRDIRPSQHLTSPLLAVPGDLFSLHPD